MNLMKALMLKGKIFKSRNLIDFQLRKRNQKMKTKTQRIKKI